MRSMTPASASAASEPPEGGATTTFAPKVRNSRVNLRSASRSIFNSAEEIAAPLDKVMSASARRARLAPSRCRRIRQNMDREGTASLSPQDQSGLDPRGMSERNEAAEQGDNGSQDEDHG